MSAHIGSFDVTMDTSVWIDIAYVMGGVTALMEATNGLGIAVCILRVL